jgi:hypothetical protein
MNEMFNTIVRHSAKINKKPFPGEYWEKIFGSSVLRLFIFTGQAANPAIS